MLSIDEAIAHAREVANTQKGKSGICLQNGLECEHFSDCLKCAEEHEQLAEWLEELKQLREQTTWIPCSERLPEEAFGCLVTVMDCEPSTQTDFENILPYFVGYDGETWNDIDGNVIPFEVIAWMPLPQPYQYDIGKTDSSKMMSQNKS